MVTKALRWDLHVIVHTHSSKIEQALGNNNDNSPTYMYNMYNLHTYVYHGVQ